MELIGYITKPQGIKGEFRLKPEILDGELFLNLKEITFNNTNYHVEKVSLRDDFAIIKVAEISDRNIVEALRNVKVYASIETALDEDEVLIKDIIGYEVVTNAGEILGKLKDVEYYGASEIYVVDGTNEIMFPNARSIILDFDMAKKQIVIDAQILQEVRIDN